MESPQLTVEQIEVCDKFEALLRELRTGPVTSITASLVQGSPSASAHDRFEAFIGQYEAPRTIAGKLQCALDQVHAANPSEVERRAKRAADLRAELAKLDEAA